jgi:hypothetical protein
MFRHNEEVHRLVGSFENRTLAKSDWNHAAHLVVGLYYCHTLPFAVAKNIMRDGICWLNDTHGTPNTDHDGYHETLTVFWMKRIWNYLDEMVDSRPLYAIANDLVEKFKDPKLPLAYYSRERLFSAAARRDYLPPDRRINRPLALTVSLLTLKPLF